MLGIIYRSDLLVIKPGCGFAASGVAEEGFEAVIHVLLDVAVEEG